MPERRTAPALSVLLLVPLLVPLALPLLLAHAQTPATPTFTITTSNVTMPATGSGTLPYTLTSVNGYTGSVVMQCEEPTVSIGAKIPYCVTGGPPVAYTLAAGQTIHGEFGLFPSPVPLPAGFAGSRATLPAVAAALLICALLSGLTLRRRRSARWLALPLFLAALSALSSTSGCGSSGPQGLTPGTYTYAVTATDIKTNVVVSATAQVTVQ